MIKDFYNSELANIPPFDLFIDIDKISFLSLDTEAYKDGKPFLIMLSNNDIVPLDYPLYYLLNKYPGYHFFTYNLKYDMGNLIRDYSVNELIFLKRYGEVFILSHNNDDIIKPYIIQYIKPYKGLIVKLESNNSKIYLWDISQYYMLSLNDASKKYLNQSKLELETKEFTKEYVKKNLHLIKRYCLRDCRLTQKLVIKFLKALKNIKLKKVIGFYSGACIASSFFICKSKISTFGNFFNDKKFLNFLSNCYRGGKFEMIQRGYFDNIYEYDINSAYSYELSEVYDTRFCKIEKFNKKIPDDLKYGFYKIKLYNVPEDKFLPCGVKNKELLIFPAGTFESYVTLQEIKFLEKLNLDFKILEGYNLIFDIYLKPYYKIVRDIFKLKQEYKIKKDIMGYNLIKIISNGFYGKTVQITKIIEYHIDEYDELIEDFYYKLGSCFNIIHGTVITANTRIKICDLQNKYKNDCIAVHTDSLFLKKELDKEYIGNDIGKFSLEDKGYCIMVGLGQYELNGYNATRGFYSEDRNFSWKEELKKRRYDFNIKVRSRKVISWIESINKATKDMINLFTTEEKIIDLNCDLKRVWKNKFTGIDFLTKQELSEPIIL